MALDIDKSYTGQQLMQELNKKLDTEDGKIQVNEITDLAGNPMLKTDGTNGLLGKNELSICQIVSGYYIGDGKATQVINIGATPKWVLIIPKSLSVGTSGQYDDHSRMGLAVTNSPHENFAIVNGGFEVHCAKLTNSSVMDDIQTNMANNTYNYIAGI